MLNRVRARRIGFVLVVIAGVLLELSPWGERVTSAVLELQALALSHWNARPVSGEATVSGIGADAALAAPVTRPLSRAVMMSLVVIGALVWWESRLLGWAIVSSLVALAALFAASTMMLPRGVLVPTAGPGLAIIAGVLGRRALEVVIVLRDRGRPAGSRPSMEIGSGE